LPEAPRATGTVRIRDGTYSAYGQTLEISRGRVIFNGPLDNPVLDITAMRRGPAVEAGVAVTGTVLSPRIRLVSEPDVPDAQKLSWLVLGVGPDDARSGSQMVALQAAAATLFGGEGGGFVSELQQSLGLDVLTIRNAAASGFDANFGASFPGQAGTGSTPTTGASQDVIAIGKRLGTRMVVTYEQGLRGVWSLLRFQYDLTRRLSVRAQAGTDTALDLLYFYSFD
jgi:translocation and assembly module TamB